MGWPLCPTMAVAVRADHMITCAASVMTHHFQSALVNAHENVSSLWLCSATCILRQAPNGAKVPQTETAAQFGDAAWTSGYIPGRIFTG